MTAGRRHVRFALGSGLNSSFVGRLKWATSRHRGRCRQLWLSQSTLKEVTNSSDRVLGSFLVVFDPMPLKSHSPRRHQAKITKVESVVRAWIDNQLNQ